MQAKFAVIAQKNDYVDLLKTVGSATASLQSKSMRSVGLSYGWWRLMIRGSSIVIGKDVVAADQSMRYCLV